MVGFHLCFSFRIRHELLGVLYDPLTVDANQHRKLQRQLRHFQIFPNAESLKSGRFYAIVRNSVRSVVRVLAVLYRDLVPVSSSS